ncbi:hypothetical protein [Croceicoccus gelatinilyticus]|uniref:hypothetical protein n=1 Tax=Croceicoccus gelatinilyticus TaxID=2835536 RepID=UPI001BD11A88|nr:hypothetical protein [Croceicoccus gelatinilyticus]MBS7668295.1 hypothetical protein [Croceicoccus gelatinilyticus]
MKKLFLGAGLLSLAVSHPAFGEDQPLPLLPSTPWVMDYAEDSCKLRRAFRSEEDDGEGKPYMLEFQQYGPSDSFDVMVYGKGLKQRQGRDLTIRWSEDGPDREEKAKSLIEVDDHDGVIFSHTFLDPEIKTEETPPLVVVGLLQDAEAKADGLYLLKGLRSDVIFKTGNLRPAFDAMRKCTDELMRHWGIDVAAYKARISSPKPIDYKKWVRRFVSLFPQERAARYSRFHNSIRLDIDETGAVTACHTLFRMEPENVMKESCDLIKKVAKFEPAIGRDGSPIKGIWQTDIVYVQE